MDPRSIGQPGEQGMRHYSYHPQIAVLGGGPAGLSAALAAAHSGKQVMLLENNR